MAEPESSSIAAQAPPRFLWRQLREAIGGTEADYTRIGLRRAIFLLAVSVVYFVYNQDLISLFSADPTVISIGGEWLRILSSSYFVYGWWMVSVQAFNGAGDTATPVGLFTLWLFTRGRWKTAQV